MYSSMQFTYIIFGEALIYAAQWTYMYFRRTGTKMLMVEPESSVHLMALTIKNGMP